MHNGQVLSDRKHDFGKALRLKHFVTDLKISDEIFYREVSLSASHYSIALYRILETVVTFHFSGGKVYSLNKGCHTCMIKHTMHVQSLHFLLHRYEFSLTSK